MKRYWEQLKPQERRWAVGIGVVVFLMLNYFFIWPHRHDWGRDSARMTRAMQTNSLYRAELGHKDEYVRKLRELQSDGSAVLAEDQAIDFIHFYSSREVNNRITPLNNGPLVTRTNEFFVEQQMGISVQSDETNLVNFLYSLSAGNSMMRVRAMSLHPDPGHQQLSASLTLVASYQKKAPARSTGPGAVAPGKAIPRASQDPAYQPSTSPPQASSPQSAAFPRPPTFLPSPPAFSQNRPGFASNTADHANKTAGPFARPVRNPATTTAQ